MKKVSLFVFFSTVIFLLWKNTQKSVLEPTNILNNSRSESTPAPSHIPEKDTIPTSFQKTNIEKEEINEPEINDIKSKVAKTFKRLLNNPNMKEEQAESLVQELLKYRKEANEFLWERFESQKLNVDSNMLSNVSAFLLNFEENHERLNREISNLLDQVKLKNYEGDAEAAAQDNSFNRLLSLHSFYLQSTLDAEKAYQETLTWVDSSRNEFYKESLLTQFMTQFPDFVEENQDEFCKNLDGKICG